MKISLNWLKDYVHFTISAKELAHRLTLSGLEVEKEESCGTDTIFEFEVTPNRPDCLSILGIARELSAILHLPLKKPFIKSIKIPKQKSDITIADLHDCSRYIGAVLQNICVQKTPPTLQKHITSIGLRSVNNIVDITNFCLMELGQPMHAFDLDKLEGRKIIVRRAKQGEKIVAINDAEYTLDSSVLVIADERKAVAIAGIMGGKETEVTEDTKNVLLESACFDPHLIRRTSRKLGLRSDASYRFERGVDNVMVEMACRRAINLIVDAAGAKLVSFNDVHAGFGKISKPQSILFDVEKAARFLGTPLMPATVKNILEHLEFDVRGCGRNKLAVIPPSFRMDIKSDIDITEEIGRIIGFDNLSTRLAAVNPVNMTTSPKRCFKEKIAQLLAGQGLSEVIAYALIGEKDLLKTKIETSNLVYNQNPLSEEQQVLRPSSIPSMIKIVAHNFKNGQKDLALFEMGRVYLPQNEQEVLSLAFMGEAQSDWRKAKARFVDFYDCKGVVENVCGSLGIGSVRYEANKNKFFDPLKSASIVVGGQEIGFLGKIQSDILENYDVKHQDVYCAQISLDALWQQAAQEIRRYVPLCVYPGVVRDVSLAVKDHVSYQRLVEAVESLQETLLKKIDLIEQYVGDKIPHGHKGVTLSLMYQSSERTLTEKEVEEAHQRICQKIIDEFSAIKR